MLSCPAFLPPIFAIEEVEIEILKNSLMKLYLGENAALQEARRGGTRGASEVL